MAIVAVSVLLGLVCVDPARAERELGPRSTASAAPAQDAVTVSTRDTSRRCATKARKQAKSNKKYKYWVCLGNRAKYLKKNRPSVNPAVSRDAQRSAPKGDGSLRPLDVDPQDSLCELVPECANIRTLYRADIKGNAFYGYGDEIWGSFDVVYTQYFNGASSNYNLKLIWDSGYAVDSRYWSASVRRELTGVPDPTTGTVSFRPNRISNNAWTAIEPGQGRFSATRPTPFTGRHHDDLYGSFLAHGQIFGTSTMHLPDFHCPTHSCKYYGPTGPV